MEKEILKRLNAVYDNYDSSIQLIEGLEYSQKDTLRRIEFYSNSKYLNGNQDSLGRDKPFMQNGNAKVNIAIRATDFDTKDIRITSDKPHSSVKSMVYSHEVYQWAKRTVFGKTLNEMGATRPRYGGVMVKKVIRDGELYIEVPAWKNLRTSQVDICKAPIMEEQYVTMVEMARMLPELSEGMTMEQVMEMAKKNSGKRTVSFDDTICLIEVHGEFPTEWVRDNGTEYEYCNQYILICGSSGNKQCILHIEEEDESPYKYLPWRAVPGRALGVGVIEDGFESQTWTNDIILKQRDLLEFASKIVFKSTDPSLVGNIITDYDSGHIFGLETGDFGVVQTNTGQMPMFQQALQQWQEQFDRVASTFESNSGETMPSGTPFRQVAILNQEANSLFRYRRQEMGIFLQEIITDWVLPHLVKRINRAHILSSEFSPAEIKAIDDALATAEANEKFAQMVLDRKDVYKEDYDAFLETQKSVRDSSSRRFLSIPDGYFTDFEPYVTVITTGEQYNKAVQLESLFSILQTVAKIPNVLQDPVLSSIFARLVEIADVGISPATLIAEIQNQQQPQPQVQPQQNPAMPQQQMAAMPMQMQQGMTQNG